MQQIIYFSRATRPMSGEDLKGLLDKARTHNQAHKISGLLLYQAGFFLQVLEGDPEVVMDLFARIEKDERHTGVQMLFDQEVAERGFADWSMGFHVVTDPDLASCEGYSDVLTGEVPTTEIDLANEMTFCMVSMFKQYVRAAQEKGRSSS